MADEDKALTPAEVADVIAGMADYCDLHRRRGSTIIFLRYPRREARALPFAKRFVEAMMHWPKHDKRMPALQDQSEFLASTISMAAVTNDEVEYVVDVRTADIRGLLRLVDEYAIVQDADRRRGGRR